jgi:hypothetical protein
VSYALRAAVLSLGLILSLTATEARADGLSFIP